MPLFPYSSPFIKFCSRDFKIFQNNKTPLFTDVIVLSEFYNRLLKMAYNSYCAKYVQNQQNFSIKDYRKTQDGASVMQNLCFTIQEILKSVKMINPNYSEPNFVSNITPLNCTNLDFNDLHIVSVCSQNNFCLWTNDFDFKGQQIDIFTENQKY